MPCGGGIEHNRLILHVLNRLHNFSERHGLIDTGDGRSELRNKVLRRIIQSISRIDIHGRINLHRKQVIPSVELGRLLANLLAESVTQVVCGVGGNDQNTLAVLGERRGQTTGGGRLSNTSLSSDEDPLEGSL